MAGKEVLFDTTKYSLKDVVGDEQLFDEYSYFISQQYHSKAELGNPRKIIETDPQAVRRDFYIPKVSESAWLLFDSLTSEDSFRKYQKTKDKYGLWKDVLRDVYRIYENVPEADQLRGLTDAQLRQIQHERSLVAFGAKQKLARYIDTVNDRRAMENAGDIAPIYWNEFGYVGDVIWATKPNYHVKDYDKYQKLAYTLAKQPYSLHMEIPPQPKPRR